MPNMAPILIGAMLYQNQMHLCKTQTAAILQRFFSPDLHPLK